MEEILTTDRLRLRKFVTDDAPFVMELTNSADWLANIGNRNTGSLELTMQYLENGALKSYRENGYGGYMVELIATGQPIGMTGLFRRPGLDHPDIGFAFMPEHYGKGYASEAAHAVLGYARDTLKLPIILGIVLPSNKGSVRVLEKIGLQFRGMVVMPGDTEELMLYSIEF